MNDKSFEAPNWEDRSVPSEKRRFNLGRVGMALSLVPFAAIALGAALGVP